MKSEANRLRKLLNIKYLDHIIFFSRASYYCFNLALLLIPLSALSLVLISALSLVLLSVLPLIPSLALLLAPRL